jgi:hypothetical protein
MCARTFHDITQSFESLDVENAIGFTHDGRIIRLSPTREETVEAELTNESDPASLREFLATAVVPDDLAALAYDPLAYAAFWRELDDWESRRFPLLPRSIYLRSHPRPTYAPREQP